MTVREIVLPIANAYWNTNDSTAILHLFGDWADSFRNICFALVWYSAKFLPDCR